MMDFIDEHIILLTVLLIVLIVGFAFFFAIYFSAHCVKSHEGRPYYHAPTYIKSGSVLIPVGGGVYGDTVCDEWK